MHTVSCYVTHTHVHSCIYICTYIHTWKDTTASTIHVNYPDNNKCGGTSCVCTITWLHCPRVPHGDHHLISDQAIHCSVPRVDHVPLVDALVHFVHSYIYCTCRLHMLLSWQHTVSYSTECFCVTQVMPFENAICTCILYVLYLVCPPTITFPPRVLIEHKPHATVVKV